MKIFLFLSFFVPILCFGQTLTENKVDEFTKLTIKRTSWESISKSKQIYGYFRLSKINEGFFLNFRFMDGLGSVFSVSAGASLMLKTNTDSIITLKALKYAITCIGCGSVNIIGSGAPGMEVDFSISEDGLDFLKNHVITKIRIYTNDGYMESEVKEKFGTIFIKEIELIK